MSVVVRGVSGSCILAVAFFSVPLVAQDAGWLTSMTQKISQNQVYPRIAAVRKLTGVTIMRVKLDGFGMIMQYEIATSSGSDVLDQAAQSCLDRIGQFTSPPGNAAQTVLLKFTWQPV
jgi:TonB family protein